MSDDTAGPKVFISHRFGDLKRAQAIALALHERGIKVWFDGWHVIGGDNFVRSMQDAIAWSTVGVVLLSRQGVGDGWMNAEVSALIQNAVTKGHRLIPVLMDKDAEVPPFLAYRNAVPNPLEADDLSAMLRAIFDQRGPPDGAVVPLGVPIPRDEVFMVVHSADNDILAELRPHLFALQRRGKLRVWDPSTTDVQEVVKDERAAARQRAQRAVILVSARLLADTDLEAEIVALLSAGVPLYCTYVSDSPVSEIDFVYRDVQTGQERKRFLTDFKGVNDPGKPLRSIPPHARDSVYVDLAKALMR